MNGPDPVAVVKTSPWQMYRAIVGIGAFCALLIVTVFQVTAPRIAENQARFLAAAVAEVLPAATSTLAVDLDEQGQLLETSETLALPAFLGFNDDGELVGGVITGQGMGYQDNIRVLFSYSFEKQAIIGFKVLDSKETPGLGDKVEKEAHFLANFDALDARVSADGTALANAIVTVKQGEKTEPWQLDGITGATITSDAIGVILNTSASVWVPAFERDARNFSAPEPQPTGTEDE
jgi:electron transport complex protein RnfG